MITVTPQYLAEQGLSADFPVRFWAKVKKTETCWIWIGAKAATRYGHIRRGNGRLCIRSHIASWILHYGPIPTGKHVLHDCPGGDNSLCIRPDHLWLGTHLQNMQDMAAKGRSRALKGESHPLHKLTIEQVASIRQLYSPILRNGEILALAFRVSRVQIHHITTRGQRQSG